MSATFEVQGVWLRRFAKDQKACADILQDITLDIPKQRITVLLGPSGAGKSSLLRLFSRLEEPSQGQIRLDGREIRELDVIALRRRVGVLAQVPALFEGSVEMNLEYGPRLAHRPFSLSDGERLLALVGLPGDFLTREARTLSVGEQKRAALARALANGPEVLLLDEPTAALDPTSAGTILNLIQDLKAKLRLTILFVTHIMEEARALGEKVVLLDGGKVISQGAGQAFFLNPPSEIAQRFLNGRLERAAP